MMVDIEVVILLVLKDVCKIKIQCLLCSQKFKVPSDLIKQRKKKRE